MRIQTERAGNQQPRRIRRRSTRQAPAGYELLKRYSRRGVALKVAEKFSAADAQIIRRPGSSSQRWEIWLQP